MFLRFEFVYVYIYSKSRINMNNNFINRNNYSDFNLPLFLSC